MTSELKHTVCRLCGAGCNLIVSLRNGAMETVRGDKNDPVYYGYSCIKGREVGSVLTLPSRLLKTVKREADGTHSPIAASQAAAEVADKLRRIVDEHGPHAVAMYIGTYAYLNSPAFGFGKAFMQGLGSAMVFTSATIDQPGKVMAPALHGPWLAGTPGMEDWDALLLVGSNPVVSMNGALGVNPARALKQAQYRGMKLVVIDPRRSECARHADIHLQCRPGEDAAILACLAREWILSGKVDEEFLTNEAEGLVSLRAAVMPFTPEYVARRAGVSAADLIAAAHLLGDARCGAVSAGTGPNMSGRSNVVEYLVSVLTSLRGWWLRAGQLKRNPGVLIEPLPPIAASPGPRPASGFGHQLRVRGLGDTAAGLPTAALADEILQPGDGQVKALIVVGGNPVAAWPDQVKALEAMQALELLVCLDPRLSDTARYAHYVFAPKLGPEVETNSAVTELLGAVGPGWGYEQPYALVAPAVVDPPPGSELIEEWEVFYEIARRMEVPLAITPFSILDPVRASAAATSLDMQNKPSTQDVWRMILKGAPVDYDRVREKQGPQLFDSTPVVIQGKPEGWSGRLQLGAASVMQELADIAAEEPADDAAYPLRLISRRLNDVMNSNWHDNPRQRRKWAYNPAFMNPQDLEAIGAVAGDVVEIRSERGMILGIAEPAADVRAGCVSMSHCWGRAPGEPEDPRRDGSNTNRLIYNDRHYDPYTGIPRMSGVPVRVNRAPAVS